MLTAPRTLREVIATCANVAYDYDGPGSAALHVVRRIRSLAALWPDAQCVPVEPTEKMVEAFLGCMDDDFKSWNKADAEQVWKAMLSAALEDGNG